MQKFLGTLTIILLSAVAGHSQLDNGPIRVGYAVITPVSSTGTIVAFETFGFRRTAETTQASVLPTALTTSAMLFVSTSGRLQRNLGVAVVNPNNSTVTVTMTLRREDGTVLATAPMNVLAFHHRAEFVTELFGNQSALQQGDFIGSLTINSTGPVAVMGLRFRGLNFSTLPVTNLSAGSPVPVITTGVGGSGAVLLPHVAVGGSWATQIVVANTGATSVTVRVDLFRQDGTPLATEMNGTIASVFNNIVIPAGGVVSLAPRNILGDDDF